MRDPGSFHITRRDFVRIAGGTLVAAEIGFHGCTGDDDASPVGGDAGPDGFLNTGAAGQAGFAGGSEDAGGGGTGGTVGGQDAARPLQQDGEIRRDSAAADPDGSPGDSGGIDAASSDSRASNDDE